MQYLLDTCVVSDFLNGNTSTKHHLLSILPENIAISSIVLMELEYGLELKPEKRKKYAAQLSELLAAIEVLPFDRTEAKEAAKIRVFLQKKGLPIGAYDVLIAATTLATKRILVTSSIKEFSRIPELKIENWREE